jgi:ribosomal peptide maturation radical SAM protein 1
LTAAAPSAEAPARAADRRQAAARVLLISTPWPKHRSPSIQIAALKAHLAEHMIDAIADHFFLRVAAWMGFDVYANVFEPDLEDGEALYGALLYPDQMPRVLASTSLARKKLRVRQDNLTLRIPSRRFFAAFARMHEEALDRFDFDRIGLVGLTLNFGQTLASAYLARLIKQRAPHVRIVIGGAEATGELGLSLLKEFPQFDYACSGEGEQALLALAQAVGNPASGLDDNVLPPGIASISSPSDRLAPQMGRFDALPVPDFDDYFELLGELGEDPVELCDFLPFETSRGCYYSCSFCSLNLQWDGYRQGSPGHVADKLALLRKKHGTIDFCFVDNITPTHVEDIAESIAAQQVDYRFFYEARVNLPRATWKALADAGLRSTQLGIEAISDGLLQIYRKKSTVLHNLQALKNCYEFGIAVYGNLIVGHPYSTRAHIDESLEAFEFVRAFPPSLSTSHYALLVGSPDFKTKLEGVRVTGNYPSYRRAYPDDALERLHLPRKAYEVTAGDATDFAPLIAAIDQWEADYCRLQARFGGKVPIMACHDGGDFLRIEDWRSGERTNFILDATERKVYLAIDQIQPANTICEQTGLDRSCVDSILRDFHKERIAFLGNGRALGLALRKRGAPA